MNCSPFSKIITLYLFATVFLFGCSKDNQSPNLPDLSIYGTRLQEEAKNRGYDFDLSNIQWAYVDTIMINGDEYCGRGYANYNGTNTRRIEISKSSTCQWSQRSDIERENLVFHEIGHAFFDRPHKPAEMCDGKPLSIMSEKYGWNKYTAQGDLRDYYISELIDPLVDTTQCIYYEHNWRTDS